MMCDIWPVRRNEGYILRAAYLGPSHWAQLNSQSHQWLDRALDWKPQLWQKPWVCSCPSLMHLGKSFRCFEAEFSHMKMWEVFFSLISISFLLSQFLITTQYKFRWRNYKLFFLVMHLRKKQEDNWHEYKWCRQPTDG